MALNMKKILFLLLIPLMLLGADFSKKLGMQFGLSALPTIGVKYHVNSAYALQPSFGCYFSRDHDTESDIYSATRVYRFLLGQYAYFPSIKKMDHALFMDAGVEVKRSLTDGYPDFYRDEVEKLFVGNVGYSLEFLVNEHISFWGKLSLAGYMYTLDREYEHVGSSGDVENDPYQKELRLLSLENSSIGVTFYIR